MFKHKRKKKGMPTVFTHNCQQRMICGPLGSVASRMALDDNQATTINGEHKGAGMVKAQGVIQNVQYYFEEQDWIKEWYRDRGLTDLGYDPKDLEREDPMEDFDMGEREEDISIQKQTTHMEFNGLEKDIDNTRDQKFKEV